MNIQLALGMTGELLLSTCCNYYSSRWTEQFLYKQEMLSYYLLSVGHIDIGDREQVYCKRCVYR